MFEAIIITAIILAVLFTVGWLHALTKELFDHSRGMNKTDANIASLVNTATLNDKTLEWLIVRINKLQAEIDIIKTAAAYYKRGLCDVQREFAAHIQDEAKGESDD